MPRGNTLRILAASVFIAGLMIVITLVLNEAGAQAPPPSEQLDPYTLAMIQAVSQAAGQTDWTPAGLLGAFFTLGGGGIIAWLRSGGLVVTWRMAEEDRTAIRQFSDLAKEALATMKEFTEVAKESLDVRDLLTQVNTTVNVHVDEIKELRHLKHDIPKSLQPITMQIARIEGILESYDRRDPRS